MEHDMDIDDGRGVKTNKTFRATKAEQDAYDRAAAAAGRSTSEWIRRTLNAACGADGRSGSKRTDVIHKNVFLIRRLVEALLPQERSDEIMERAMAEARADFAPIQKLADREEGA